ncbi:hypothetical protein DNA98_02720 [Meiothermus sp. Pnk-1]|nr:hypothetical protein DNA98_02720 [Meiothermus sp. Pnk-1]
MGLLGIGAEPVVLEEHELDLAGVRQLEARTFNGAIIVQLGAEPPHLTLRRKGEVHLTLERRGDTLFLEARKRTPLCVGCCASFELALPESLSLILHSSNGAIAVRGSGAAELKLHTSNGRITVREARGPVSAKTSNGAIEVRQVEGAVEARTSNGAVVLEDLTLPPGSQSKVVTSNGAIKVRRLLAPGGLEAEGYTSNGSVHLELPGASVQLQRQSFSALRAGSSPARLRLESSNGGIWFQ